MATAKEELKRLLEQQPEDSSSEELVKGTHRTPILSSAEPNSPKALKPSTHNSNIGR